MDRAVASLEARANVLQSLARSSLNENQRKAYAEELEEFQQAITVLRLYRQVPVEEPKRSRYRR